ncbi:MAG: hypothetical protein Ct9H300mP14_10500 [Gammaproteobacteria bacterium]|nr:MAG: hypothetical protein Ct9H300mP14_10500 [Gammaproteobacteria bacterium]
MTADRLTEMSHNQKQSVLSLECRTKKELYGKALEAHGSSCITNGGRPGRRDGLDQESKKRTSVN